MKEWMIRTHLGCAAVSTLSRGGNYALMQSVFTAEVLLIGVKRIQLQPSSMGAQAHIRASNTKSFWVGDSANTGNARTRWSELLFRDLPVAVT